MFCLISNITKEYNFPYIYTKDTECNKSEHQTRTRLIHTTTPINRVSKNQQYNTCNIRSATLSKIFKFSSSLQWPWRRQLAPVPWWPHTNRVSWGESGTCSPPLTTVLWWSRSRRRTPLTDGTLMSGLSCVSSRTRFVVPHPSSLYYFSYIYLTSQVLYILWHAM